MNEHLWIMSSCKCRYLNKNRVRCNLLFVLIYEKKNRVNYKSEHDCVVRIKLLKNAEKMILFLSWKIFFLRSKNPMCWATRRHKSNQTPFWRREKKKEVFVQASLYWTVSLIADSTNFKTGNIVHRNSKQCLCCKVCSLIARKLLFSLLALASSSNAVALLKSEKSWPRDLVFNHLFQILVSNEESLIVSLLIRMGFL